MLNLVFSSFAFAAGLAAFFSPCSASLLPGYVSYYISKHGKDKSFTQSLISGATFGLTSILGFFTVFGISGFLVIYFGQFVKKFIPVIALVTGSLLIILGIYMFKGKNVMLRIPGFQSGKREGAYFFGISFAIAALGCTFPLFATVLLQSITDTSIISGLFSLLAYIVGISLMMVIFTTISSVAKKFLQKKLTQIIPIIHKLGAILIIVAGLYVIYYQSLILL